MFRAFIISSLSDLAHPVSGLVHPQLLDSGANTPYRVSMIRLEDSTEGSSGRSPGGSSGRSSPYRAASLVRSVELSNEGSRMVSSVVSPLSMKDGEEIPDRVKSLVSFGDEQASLISSVPSLPQPDTPSLVRSLASLENASIRSLKHSPSPPASIRSASSRPVSSKSSNRPSSAGLSTRPSSSKSSCLKADSQTSESGYTGDTVVHDGGVLMVHRFTSPLLQLGTAANAYCSLLMLIDNATSACSLMPAIC